MKIVYTGILCCVLIFYGRELFLVLVRAEQSNT